MHRASRMVSFQQLLLLHWVGWCDTGFVRSWHVEERCQMPEEAGKSCHTVSISLFFLHAPRPGGRSPRFWRMGWEFQTCQVGDPSSSTQTVTGSARHRYGESSMKWARTESMRDSRGQSPESRIVIGIMTGIDLALATRMRDATHRMGLALHRVGLHGLKGDTVIMLIVHPTRSCWALLLARQGYRILPCWGCFFREMVYRKHLSCWGRILWKTGYHGQDSCWFSIPFQGRSCHGAQAFCWVLFPWELMYHKCMFSWGQFLLEPVYQEPDSGALLGLPPLGRKLPWARSQVLLGCLLQQFRLPQTFMWVMGPPGAGHPLIRFAAQLGLPLCGRQLPRARSAILLGHLPWEIRLQWLVSGTDTMSEPDGGLHCTCWPACQLDMVRPGWHSHGTCPPAQMAGPGPGRQWIVNQQRGITDLGHCPLNPASLTWCQQHSTDTWQLLWCLQYPEPNRLWHLATSITLEMDRIKTLTVHQQWTIWCLLRVDI